MMREIKFRALDVRHNEWIAGFNLHNFHHYYTKGLSPTLTRYDHEWEKDGFILEQFTGLKDNNGKDIYEGDIVSANTNCMFDNGRQNISVMFEGGSFVVSGSKCQLSLIVDGFDAMVIGNIHQNPELLETLR